MSSSEEAIATTLATGEAFAAFIETLSDEAFHRRPEPEAWSAAELSGHVAEFPATFARQCALVAAEPGRAIGRNLDDPGRLAAISTLEGRGPVEAAAAIRATIAAAVETLRSIPAAGWDAVGRQPDGSDVAVRVIAEWRIAGHLVMHLKQARAAVG
ncbi:MAG: DinB family protein [Chloroflexi bacterium]|nr:DinB family protein [Chloroflexota bacterium]